MASLNKCIFIGNLGRDPETRYSASGDAICMISIACSESWKDRNTGEKKEQTEWIRVVFYRKLAEIAAEYLHKGSQVYVEGKMRTRKWADKDGTERYTTEIIADDMRMLGARTQQGATDEHDGYGQTAAQHRTPPQPASQRQQQGASRPAPSGDPWADMDIPFADPYRGKYIHAF